MRQTATSRRGYLAGEGVGRGVASLLHCLPGSSPNQLLWASRHKQEVDEDAFERELRELLALQQEMEEQEAAAQGRLPTPTAQGTAAVASTAAPNPAANSHAQPGAPAQEMTGGPTPAPHPPATHPPATLPPPQPREAAALHLRPGCPLLPPGQEAVERCKEQLSRRWSPWERQSHPLAVGEEARAAFRQLLPWVESEVAALGDATLEQEAALLRTLAAA